MTEETNMRINEIIDKGMTREQMQENINTSMTATRNALQKYAQRQKDIANINYFLSDKVDRFGHNPEVSKECERLSGMLMKKIWDGGIEKIVFRHRVFKKLFEIHCYNTAH